jgi:hypothetical protein
MPRPSDIFYSLFHIYKRAFKQEKDKVMLRPTVSRQVCLGVKPRLGRNAIFLLLSDSYESVHVGCLLWRRGVCRFKLLLAFASEVMFDAGKISSMCHLYLHFYVSGFYTVVCQESGSLWIPTIYTDWQRATSVVKLSHHVKNHFEIYYCDKRKGEYLYLKNYQQFMMSQSDFTPISSLYHSLGHLRRVSTSDDAQRKVEWLWKMKWERRGKLLSRGYEDWSIHILRI